MQFGSQAGTSWPRWLPLTDVREMSGRVRRAQAGPGLGRDYCSGGFDWRQREWGVMSINGHMEMV